MPLSTSGGGSVCEVECHYRQSLIIWHQHQNEVAPNLLSGCFLRGTRDSILSSIASRRRSRDDQNAGNDDVTYTVD